MRPLAAAPEADVARPASVLAFADGCPTHAVWRNAVGGLTFRVERPGGDVFVKWNPHGSGESLAAEAERLAWIGGRFPVPRVVDAGADETGEWLATAAIDGASAVSEPWIGRPREAARAMGRGLRALHEAFGPSDCPFDWSVDARLAVAGAEAPGPVPGIDRLVVCHGDPCAPNTLVAADGSFAALVDLARLGVADRWADLAVGSWSLEWNFGPGHEADYFDAYGIRPDPERIAFYRALWDAT